MATGALAWTLSKGTYPIMGLRSRERIDQAVEAVGLRLAEEEIGYLEEPYRPKQISY
ncbi:uncharacterized protein BJX67DRAFT_349802 [Aspergillus lucknowensis]|uniref:NADP-dependent oxidoreductase domain-containing protein n=1 Tax=Aspergillus lucknowensis TaxID=176173 RepID=A0ABR4LVJ7_9EURO